MRFRNDSGQWAPGNVVWALVGLLLFIVLLVIVIRLFSGTNSDVVLGLLYG